MGGEGSMSHAIASLKANKRKRNVFPTKDLDFSIHTDPIFFKKSSIQERKKVAQRLQSLQDKEKIRLRLVIFLTFILLTFMLFMIL